MRLDQLHVLQHRLDLSWAELAWFLAVHRASIYRWRNGDPCDSDAVPMMLRWVLQALDNGAKVNTLISILGLRRLAKGTERVSPAEDQLRDHGWAYVHRFAFPPEQIYQAQLYTRKARTNV